MPTAQLSKNTLQLSLCAENAREMMTPDPVSLRTSATILEAIALLTDKGFTAAPVIDEAGQPVGVLSRTDILTHNREKNPPTSEPGSAASRGVPVDKLKLARVRDVMTPVIFSIAPDTPANRVVEEMLALHVHQLFVVENGILVGVISSLDVLRHLAPEGR